MASRVFDFSSAMRVLCEDIADRVPEFDHVRMGEIAVCFAQARSHVQHGLQAKLTPLRFEQGALEGMIRGQRWRVQQVMLDGREMLYLLTFYLPRFFNHDLREKLVTVFHELYHISPDFDGDIRRFSGHYHVHTHSQREYDEHMGVFVDRYLASRPPRRCLEFLQFNHNELVRRYGSIVGLRVPIPKLLPVARPAG